MRKFIVFSFIVFLLAALSGCGRDTKMLSRTDFKLNTVITITGYDTDDDVLNGAFLLCDKYERMLSMTVSGSDIWRINHAGGETVRVSSETAELIELSLKYCELSGGAFDISIAPLSTLWDFSSDAPGVPDSADIEKALELVEYTKIAVSGCDITLPKGMSIDLGAVAKGYIADRIADYFRLHNTCAIINLGGNVVTVGSKPDSSPWKIGIRDPQSSDGGQIGTVETAGGSFVTSGIYERCFTSDGVLYHHLLSTQDGMPVHNGIASVTVLSASSAEGDALSTTLFLMGLDDAMNYVNSCKGIEAVFVMEDGTVLCSDNVSVKK